ncbi:MAG: double-strand break repair helicase AddA [Kiloniellales bacterium]|nr:double-strand break repair helicase AddA [Kiloniellales bacterium]
MSGASAEAMIARASALQVRAADPERSIWVAASAGTGKTKVLTDRVLSLMLAGTPPERLLCLTFTKAAAAEMATRIARRLADWTTVGEDTLAAALTGLLGRMPEDGEIALARQLFARVLDAEGGLKIQTIHAFCQSLLGRFPLESRVAPHFQVLDERSAAELLAAAREAVLARSAAEPGGAVANALEWLAGLLDETRFTEVLAELTRERGRFTRQVERLGSAGLAAAINARLGIGREETPEVVLAEAVADSALDLMGLQLVVSALEAGTDKERTEGATLKLWLALPAAARADAFEDYAALFLTAKGELRKRLLTKAAQAAVPGAEAIMAAEGARLQAVLLRRNKVVTARATQALATLGAAVLEGYEHHKAWGAFLDYDDLILKTRDLLQSQGMTGWVLFKLDGGLDHVLIDEAQDTNPEQWQIVEALTREFFAGEGAREGPRTVFAVGDAKQSIFGFQRAKPEEFLRLRGVMAARTAAAGQRWDDVDLDVSFRSTEAVLAAVDAVFAGAAARDGVLPDARPLRHEASRRGQAGVVELWPPAPLVESESEAPWSAPLERRGTTPPRRRLARLIACRIHHWTLDPKGAEDPESQLPSKGRRLRPEDFLILVRRRNEFVEEVVRELKLLRVPVAGVDRMVLTDQLAVMDLIALGRFLLMPEDDLTLATVLKGPFIGFDEEQLFALAHGRPGTLWQALRDGRGETLHARMALDLLSELLAQVDTLPPYELYAEMLGRRRGRESLLARLGREAADPIEEFMGLALAYEREHPPSLEGFLHWLEAGQQEVKRDLEHGGRAVRVMTVHGAKGLQAPVVFLPDTLQLPQSSDSLFWLDDEDLLLWPPRRAWDDEVAEAARARQREAQLQEYRRLLYVAMTRAEDRLYVCGWAGRNDPPEGCWYDLVRQGLAARAEAVDFDFSGAAAEGWAGPGQRLATAQAAAPEPAEAGPPPLAPGKLPDWASRPPVPERLPPQPLAPSRPRLPEPPLRSPLGAEEGAALRRGRLVHRLLELLPELPAQAWAAAGARLLALPQQGLTPEEAEALLTSTLALLDHPDFVRFLGPGSRAEVPLAGVIEGRGGPQVVAGQIDRLVVEAESVAVVDYKSNRRPPDDPAGVPEVYLKQMAAYRALLAEIYPKRRIDCYLLWTEGPRLMQLRSAQLADHAP